jgi:hypothetical protein
MKITSPAFDHEDMIPTKYGCRGDDVSPPLRFEDVPSGARSLALVMDDPDAPVGTWDHWLWWDLDPSTTTIGEDRTAETLGAVPGKNSWGRNDYGGPCPPSGTHRYLFKLYALDAKVGLRAGADKAALERAMAGHIVAEAVLVGKVAH